MKIESFIDILHCVQKTPENQVCKGTLKLSDDKLTCDICNFQYRRVQGIPVLKSESLESSDTWFEQMYTNRSRTLEITSNYLQHEREFMVQFMRQFNIQGSCLEIGCGVGLFAEIFPKFIGLEYSLESLFADGFESFNRICADARLIPITNSSVECIFSFNTLEHVPNVDLAFSEIDRILKSGGFLVLEPAWHCTSYNTELIPVLPYSDLNLRQKLIKFLLPLLTSKLYKFFTKIPWRLWRRVNCSRNNPLSWKKLTPYHGDLWSGGDSDAVASIDSHEAILFYQSRGYECISHSTVWKQITAGHDIVILRK
jgi:SAM-dependent methyltransferase